MTKPKKPQDLKTKAFEPMTSLARERLGPVCADTDEMAEIVRICNKGKYVQQVKSIYLLTKLGDPPSKIMALCDIQKVLYDRLWNTIKCSKYLMDRMVSNMNRSLEKTVETATEQVLEGEIIEETFENTITPVLEDKLTMLLNSITEGKIIAADLDEVASAFKKIFDAYRTNSGKSNINIMGVQALVGSGPQDAKRLAKLSQDLEKLNNALERAGHATIQPASTGNSKPDTELPGPNTANF